MMGTMERKNKKVFVAMSGGVDSSVAALLLKKQGYDVTGVFMRCYNIDGCAERDAEDARRVAEHIEIPFYIFDFEKEYKKRVVAYMVEGYRAGITPNPDVMCNREIKFGLFFKKAIALGTDYVATGHYARVRELKTKNSKPKTLGLFAGKDPNKDQSYFLWTLTQKELLRTLFPVGDYLKPEVRALAKRAGLPTAEKKDSQGICFLGDVSLMDFLKTYLPQEKGAVFNIEGEKIGEHEGAHFYTIGQRHIGVAPRTKGGATARHYVALTDVATNTVIVAEGPDHPALYRKELALTDMNFVRSFHHSPIRANWRMKVMVRIRYRQPLSPATLYKLKTNNYKLTFDEGQKFVAPGQSAVMYGKNRELLAGGVIQ
ncbi:MAG: tRNA 2-thiouridine(34) synthase MnmA [Candidatus Jorgensenbacteria bacterium]|nr:tRNA 2-thiouridine(34) synthase MnmA [Candidatus Jorgensenbacteria bacterium]